jgi:peptidoglycan-associated lipoprotein
MRYGAMLAMAATLLACHKTARPPVPEPPAAPTPPPPAPEPPPSEPPPAADEYSRMRGMDLEAINALELLPDIHFDFDRADILARDRSTLGTIAGTLRRFDFLDVTIEGHCDERGTADYNLALGERRARAAYDYLVSLGVPASRLRTVSYGKESPLCLERREECWARNRRTRFTVTGKTADHWLAKAERTGG